MAARIAGVRPSPTSPLWAGGRLRFADAGSLSLAPGDWVVVDRGEREIEPWIGEVIVAPDQLVEAARLGDLPEILRLADAGERPPARVEGDGLRLLRSLELPDSATHPGPARS